jgi:hypothetical protein
MSRIKASKPNLSERPEKFTVTLLGAVQIGAKLFRAEDFAK